ncbi:MAG: hypothetical protein ACTH6N_04575 [Brachybacterium tyrofermentans]|uniref:hypothetical protein n=1 Tax=Brachybacterium tyrofermentans TaxID=47848 RepID=UPI0018669072|nr:hypothetical protein [Brachybacterium tyrofermentans]
MDAVTEEDVTTMTDAELAAQGAKIEAERSRRAVITDAEQRTDTMCLEYLQASGRINGGPFETPMGFLGAYPRGWRVTHNGGTYEAIVPGAAAEPPGPGWVEVDADTALVDFWEDREYAAGEQARDAGQIWTAMSTVDGPRPSNYPGGWSPTA